MVFAVVFEEMKGSAYPQNLLTVLGAMEALVIFLPAIGRNDTRLPTLCDDSAVTSPWQKDDQGWWQIWTPPPSTSKDGSSPLGV